MVRGVVFALAAAVGCGGGDDSKEVALEAACGALEDEGIDGTGDVRWVHELDVDGHIVRADGDRDGGGDPDEVYTYEWNTDGRLIAETGPIIGFDHSYRSEYDWDGVNLIEYRYLYDTGAGLELVYRFTRTFTGGPDLSEAWDWDGDGDHLGAGQLDSTVTDWNGDGQIDVSATYEYEADHIVRSTAIENVDQFGERAIYSTWTYTDDALVGIQGFTSMTVPPDTVPEREEAWTLDDADRVVEYRSYMRGRASWVTTTTRDARGLPIEVATDYLDGSKPDLERMEYDGDRMMRYEVRTDRETTAYDYEFDCGP
jgi:hypothetical protein